LPASGVLPPICGGAGEDKSVRTQPLPQKAYVIARLHQASRKTSARRRFPDNKADEELSPMWRSLVELGRARSGVRGGSSAARRVAVPKSAGAQSGKLREDGRRRALAHCHVKPHNCRAIGFSGPCVAGGRLLCRPAPHCPSGGKTVGRWTLTATPEQRATPLPTLLKCPESTHSEAAFSTWIRRRRKRPHAYRPVGRRSESIETFDRRRNVGRCRGMNLTCCH